MSWQIVSADGGGVGPLQSLSLHTGFKPTSRSGFDERTLYGRKTGFMSLGSNPEASELPRRGKSADSRIPETGCDRTSRLNWLPSAANKKRSQTDTFRYLRHRTAWGKSSAGGVSSNRAAPQYAKIDQMLPGAVSASSGPTKLVLTQ